MHLIEIDGDRVAPDKSGTAPGFPADHYCGRLRRRCYGNGQDTR